MRPAFASLTLATALACGAGLSLSRTPPETQTALVPSRPAPAPTVAGKKEVTHRGVKLVFDTALAAEVRPATEPASPLESETDKPDGVWPEHTSFTLFTTPPGRPGAGSQQPQLRVFPVREYRGAFSVSKRAQGQADAALKELRALLRRRPRSLSKNVPTLPFPDASEAFHAHVAYLKFARGAGVAYLTQAQQDASLINNEQLTYEFRGLTDDGRHYVYGSFPVAAASLPAGRDASAHDGYTLPQTFYGPREKENARAYRAYVTRVRSSLERLRPDDFTPSLRLIDEMLSSLEIGR